LHFENQTGQDHLAEALLLHGDLIVARVQIGQDVDPVVIRLCCGLEARTGVRGYYLGPGCHFAGDGGHSSRASRGVGLGLKQAGVRGQIEQTGKR
jgi:hypothetical protein